MAGGATTAFVLLVVALVGFWFYYHRRSNASQRRDVAGATRETDAYTDSAPDATHDTTSTDGGGSDSGGD